MTWHDIEFPGGRMEAEDQEFWVKVAKAFIRHVIGKEPSGCRLGTYSHEFDSAFGETKSIESFGLWADQFDYGKGEQYAETAAYVLGILDGSIDWGSVAKESITEELEEQKVAMGSMDIEPDINSDDDE